MKILYCFLYLAGTGILGFLLGRIVPKRWFCAGRFPFRVRPWEQKLYQALRVKQWQNKVPDMSRVFPKLMPPKRLTPEMMDDLPGMWGALWTAVYILLGNVAYIMIQRYNRPRLQKLLAMQEKRKAREQRREA